MMLQALRARQPGHPLRRVLWWSFLHLLCYCWVAPCYRYRSWGGPEVPRRGPLLLIANHQSFLDPILVGQGLHHRQFHALARATLFDHPLFAWLIRSLNAIPVRQGHADKAAMRRCLQVLGEGHALLVYPEGSRTPDGRTQPFAPGTLLLIRRARPWVVPVAIEGAYRAWPIWRRLPRPFGRVAVRYGRAVRADEVLARGEAGLAELRDEVERMRLALAERLGGR